MGRKRLPIQAFAAHNERAAKIRKAMIAVLNESKAKRVGVFLSAGVDSHSCLFAALATGKKVTCYSFTLDTHESTDFKVARRTAETFGLPFVGVQMPTDENSLKRYLLDLHQVYNSDRYMPNGPIHIGKTSNECLWPVFSLLSESVADNQATVIGFGADTYFCQTRSQKKFLDDYDAYKDRAFETTSVRRTDTQSMLIAAWLKHHAPKHHVIYPYYDRRVHEAFRGMHPFDEGCRPIQKAPVRLAFWSGFEQTDVRVHSNLQKGDSGVDEHFANTLLKSSWNRRGMSSVVGIYNDLEAEEISTIKGV